MKLPFLKSKGEEEIPTREQIFETRPVTEKDIIAPSSIRVNQDGIQLGNRLVFHFFLSEVSPHCLAFLCHQS